MADTFQKVADKYQNSPTVVVLFVAAVVMLVIGINNFAEDTYSSYLGLISLESTFGLKVQIFNWTYWVMSITPQIASIVFFYMFLATGEKKYMWVSLGAQVVDVFSDTWYRSGTRMLDDPMVFLLSLALTLAYFTLGSEFFLTIGAGLILKLYAPALREWNKARGNVHAAKNGGGGGQQQQQNYQGQNRQNQQGHQKGGGSGGGQQREPSFHFDGANKGGGGKHVESGRDAYIARLREISNEKERHNGHG